MVRQLKLLHDKEVRRYKVKKIAVLGAGSWGTALSIVLSDNKHDVRLWSHSPKQVEEINQQHTNEKYLDVKLPTNLQAYEDIAQAIEDVDAILFVVPTAAIREVSQKIKAILPKNVTIIHATKGIEPVTFKRISEMIAEEIPAVDAKDIVVLSGPSHAEEVALRHPTTVTVAAANISKAKYTQDLFFNEFFRVYSSTDIIGVEVGGALKNIIALGAGLSDGLGFGDNAKAALITRGIAEITRLGSALGAKPMSFLGLSGVGDLIVTCTSVHSRNWRTGNLLGKGQALDEVLEQMGMVVEGVSTTKAAFQLAKSKNVDMPITTGLYEIFYNNKSPKLVVEQLMSRDKKEEMDSFPTIEI